MARARPPRVLRIVLANVILLELLSFLAIHAAGALRPSSRLDLFVEQVLEPVDDEYVERFSRKSFDAELGWDNKPGTTRGSVSIAGSTWTASYDGHGARTHPREASRPYAIAAFGDSFTLGNDVDDDETWCYYLENELRVEVRNFGVAAYGLGQSYLKLERVARSRGLPEITILGIFEDDLGRALNSYRPFYYEHAGARLGFKPAFGIEGDEVGVIPNPSDGRLTLARARALAIEVGAWDYWAKRSLRVLPEFPFVVQVSRLFRRVAARAGGDTQKIGIWDSEDGRRVLTHIVDASAEIARAHDSHLVVLLIPASRRLKDGRSPPSYAGARHDLLERRQEIEVVDVMDMAFDEAAFNILPFKGHPSPYGNRVIATYLADRLRGRVTAG